MKKKLIIPAALTVAVLALAGCAANAEPAGKPDDKAGPGELTKVSIAAVVATSSMPVVIAQQEGIFEKHGLEVTLAPTNNLPAITPALLSGELNFAIGAAPSFVLAVDQGLPLQALAGTSSTVEDHEGEGNQLLVRSDSKFSKSADLKGKTIAVNAVGGAPHVPFLASHVMAGGGVDDFEWVVMPMNEAVAALEAGTIDGALLGEPYTAMAKLDGHKAIASAWRAPGAEILEAGEAYILVLGAKPYMDDNPEIATAMRDALIEANEVARANPQMVIDLLVEQANLDPVIAKHFVLPDFVGTLTGDELQRMADALDVVGMLEKPFDGKAAVWRP